MKTELVFCPRCLKFITVAVDSRGCKCLECWLVFSKADSNVALAKRVKVGRTA